MVRRQLTLFVPADSALALEAVRRIVDPVQAALIPAHVTLCRETEIGELSVSELEARVTTAFTRPLTLRFGRAEAFFEHGILLPCVAGHDGFDAIRQRLLGSLQQAQGRPHITLAHPRNPRAHGNALALALNLPAEVAITFPDVSLIEQAGQGRWQVLRTFVVADPPRPTA